MNTVGFHCPWDSGQVGWIHVDLAAIREDHGCQRVSPALRRKVEELRQEVSTYDDYLTGNCFGYVLETRDGEEVDSCWGFIGDHDGYCLQEARLAVTEM